MLALAKVNRNRDDQTVANGIRGRSEWSRGWARFARNRLALVSLVVSIMLLLMALLGTFINRHLLGTTPEAIDVSARLNGPSAEHPLGTDRLGRDVLARIIDGSQVSLSVAFLVICISNTVGLVVGGVAGYVGGLLDNILMRIVDALLAMPTLLLLLAILSTKPQVGVPGIALIIGLTSWMGPARLVRGEFLAIRERDFVLAARSLGASDWHIVTRHIFPNVVPTLTVISTLGVAMAILTESSLSFLGLGVQPPQASWGEMLMGAQNYLWRNPLLAVWPGLFIMISVLAFNFVGDGLREALDPRL